MPKAGTVQIYSLANSLQSQALNVRFCRVVVAVVVVVVVVVVYPLVRCRDATLLGLMFKHGTHIIFDFKKQDVLKALQATVLLLGILSDSAEGIQLQISIALK
eukprot:6455399-Amphidinium_carterae.1